MKSINFTLIILFFSTIIISSCNSSKKENLISTDIVNNPISAEGSSNLTELPKIEFKIKEHDFGKVIQGERLSFGFKFKNIGNSDLIISAVSTSCGCTASDFPTKPIKPGQEGVVKITFDSNKRKGFNNKTATVLTNGQPNKTILRIKAMVTVPEEG